MTMTSQQALEKTVRSMYGDKMTLTRLKDTAKGNKQRHFLLS